MCTIQYVSRVCEECGRFIEQIGRPRIIRCSKGKQCNGSALRKLPDNKKHTGICGLCR